MVCPNKNSKEWKDFVKKVGTEVQALGEYYNNDYAIPTTDKPVSYTNKKEIEAYVKFVRFTDAVKFSQTKTIADLEFRKTQTAAETRAAATEVVRQIEDKDSALKDIVETMITKADEVVNSLFLSEDITAKELHEQKKNLGVFDQLNDIRSIIQLSKTMDSKEKRSLIRTLDRVAGNLNTFNTQRMASGKEILIREMSKKSSIITDAAKLKYELQYRKEKPFLESNLKKEEYEENVKQYVDRTINANKDALHIETEGYIRELLETAPQDIGDIASWIDDPRGTNDHMIQLIVEYFDNADFKTQTEFTKARSIILKAHDEFMENEPLNVDQRKKYEGLIEKMPDDKGVLTETQYMVGEHFHYVKDDFYRLKAEQRSQDLTRDQKKEKANAFLEKYANEEVMTGKDPEGVPYSDKFIQSVTSGSFDIMSKEIIKPHHFNPQYVELKKDPRKFKLYKALVLFNNVSDKTSQMKNLHLKLPSITKHGAENLAEKGAKEYLKGEFRDNFKRKIDDADANVEKADDGTIKVRTDSAGNLLQQIKSAYRGDLDVSDQSFDLVGIAIANRYAVLDHKNKTNIQHKVEIAHEIMGERAIKKTKEGKVVTAITKKISSVFGEDAEDEIKELSGKGVDSNAYKVISSVIEDRLYGQGSRSTGEILGMSTDKIADQLSKVAGHTMLMANTYGAFSNVIQGKVMNFLESTKGEVFNRKELRIAEQKYWNMLGKGTIADIGSQQDKSILNLMLERFIGEVSGFDALNDKLVKGTKARRLFSTSSLHGLNASAEHYIQSTAMLAMMENTKIDGKPISDYYEVVDGNLVLPKGVKFNEEQFARKVKMTIADLHGNYSNNNKAIVQRYWAGKLAMFLRKWIVRSVKRRWSGIETVGESMDDLLNDIHKLNHRQNLGFSEGTYTSLVRYLGDLMSSIKTLKLGTMKENWHHLSMAERKNIQSAVAEIGVMVGALLASVILEEVSEDDEDDSSATWMAAYFLRRLYSESAFYVPVLGTKDTLRILDTPAATTRYLEKISDAFGFFADDAMSLLSGEDVRLRQDGSSHAIHKALKLTPIAAMLYGATAKDKYGFVSGKDSK